MGPGGRGFMDRERMMAKLKEPKPKSLREVPGYVYRVVTKFFYRLFYIFKLVWETNPWILIFLVFIAIWNGVTPVISSYIGKEVINKLSDSYIAIKACGEAQFEEVFRAQFAGVLKQLIIMFGFNFLTTLISLVSNIISNISGELVVNRVNLKIMYKSREVDLASFDDPEFYERFENAKREAGMRPIHILNSNFNMISTIISMLSFVAVLTSVSTYIPLILIVLSIPTAIITFTYRRKNFFYVRMHSKERRQMSYYSEVMTNKDMVKEIKMFNLAETFIGRYQETFKRYFRGLKKLYVQEGLWNIGLRIAATVANCLMFAYIARGVARGEYQIGDYSFYIGALQAISSGVSSIISTTASIYEGTLFIDNLIRFMDEERTIIPSIPEPRHVEHHVGHKIVFEDVSFSYPGHEKRVINHVNLTIDAGDTCVLVGINGAGKTTLIKLLTRLYDPTEGRILLDGHDIKEYDIKDLYSMFGIIFQDFGKYAVSVKENIMFGQIGKEPDDAMIEEAARQSTASVFIENLPGRYNTPLMRYFEEDGTELSIGQWQKLSIARAFYSDSDVIILDEPTASLDAIAEQDIYNQFDRLRKDKTTIFVSHRLSSATVANKIVVLENGEVLEYGNHAELMKNHGRYYELFTTQAKRYITPIDGVSAEEFMREDDEIGEFLDSSAERDREKHKIHGMPKGMPPADGTHTARENTER